MSVVAITGGTGFVGRETIRLALRAGWQVRALTRQQQPAIPGLVWVPGALDDPASLRTLMEGAAAVIHIAGVVNAPDRDAFAAGNVHGTQEVVQAAQAAGIRRFVHVSSLSAREPRLSNYGWSKAEGERAVTESSLDWTVVRPPAIYGPRDLEMLDLFRMAKFGFVITPRMGRMSVIEVTDLAALLVALVPAGKMVGQICEADDGAERGWTYTAYAQAIGMAVGSQVRVIPVSKSLMLLASRAEKLFRGKKAKLTADRVNYMCHPDWVIDPNRRPPVDVWLPRIVTRAGLKQTANAYRVAGLL